MRGKDIKRYSYNFSDKYLITTYNEYTDDRGVLHPSIDMKDYPAIKEYLDSYWNAISKRQDKGDTPYNLRRCAYMDDFNRPKLIWKVIGNQMAFALDKSKFLLNNACYILTGDYLEYLTVMLNSDAIMWYSFITNMNQTGVGDVQVGKQNIILLPIPFNQQHIQKLTEQFKSYISNEININEFEKITFDSVADIFDFSIEEQNFIRNFKNSL